MVTGHHGVVRGVLHRLYMALLWGGCCRVQGLLWEPWG
jgi:hypothetical protein